MVNCLPPDHNLPNLTGGTQQSRIQTLRMRLLTILQSREPPTGDEVSSSKSVSTTLPRYHLPSDLRDMQYEASPSLGMS